MKLAYVCILKYLIKSINAIEPVGEFPHVSTRDFLRAITLPFCTYVTTDFFKTSDKDGKSEVSQAVIENMEKYVFGNENDLNSSRAQETTPISFLTRLYDNILDGVKSCELDIFNIKPKTIKETFDALIEPSVFFLKRYIEFEEDQARRSPYIENRILSISGFGNYNTFPRLKFVYLVKEYLHRMIQTWKKNYGQSDAITIRGSMMNIGCILVVLEIKQSVLPVDDAIYNKLKNDIGVLLSVIKLIGYEQGIFNEDKGLLLMETDMKNFMEKTNIELDKFLQNTQDDKIQLIQLFITWEKNILIFNEVSSWLNRYFDESSLPNIDALLQKYIRNLHQASIKTTDTIGVNEIYN